MRHNAIEGDEDGIAGNQRKRRCRIKKQENVLNWKVTAVLYTVLNFLCENRQSYNSRAVRFPLEELRCLVVHRVDPRRPAEGG